MKKYRIPYYYNGRGICVVEADNKEEAVRKFYDGEGWQSDFDTGEDYEPDFMYIEQINQ